MKKKLLKALQYILFLALGVLIFLYVFKDVEVEEIKDGFRNANYFWIVASIFFAFLSQVSRAIRWKMLMKPLGYNPRFINVFLSVYTMYFVNLILPRAGEVARCTVLAKTDKVPFTKTVGTVVVERLADTVMLGFLAIIIFATNLDIIKRFFVAHPEAKEKLVGMLTLGNALIVLAFFALAVLAFMLYQKWVKKTSDNSESKIVQLRKQLAEGFLSIKKLDNFWGFIGHTAFIFLMWLVMLYVVFWAYEPTAHLSLRTGMVVFLMGGLSMLVPVQGGIGPWHYMVMQTLFLYQIPEINGKIFALIAHTTTNLSYIVLGAIAFLALVIINKGFTQSQKSEVD